MKLRKGDRVRVLTGKDRGKEGEIMRAMPQVDKVIVEGVNVAKKHQRATKATMQGGIIDKDMPMPVGNVAILCPTCGPTKIGYRFEKSVDGSASGRSAPGLRGARTEKHRVCRKCGGEL